MKYLSLFSGIGAFEKALTNLEIPFELVAFSEIDKYAVKSYCAIHNVSEALNLGDITKVDTQTLSKDIDLLTYGFPCQDFSLAGKQKGLFNEDGKKTRSGLFFEALRIIEDVKPKIAVAENVKNLTSKRFNAQFQIILQSLEEAGYNNYWAVLNSKDYGIPQNRERVFIVSIKRNIDGGYFKFPEPFPLELRLKDMLETEVDEKYYLQQKALEYVQKHEGVRTQICNEDTETTKCAITANGNANWTENFIKENTDKNVNSETSAGVVINPLKGKSPYGWHFEQNVYDSNGITRAVKAGGGSGNIPKVITNKANSESSSTLGATDGLKIRKLTPKECFRLMGFTDADFAKAEAVNSNTQLYKQAGNSIVVDVLAHIFTQLKEVYI